MHERLVAVNKLQSIQHNNHSVSQHVVLFYHHSVIYLLRKKTKIHLIVYAYT